MLRGEFLRGELRGELPAPGVRAGTAQVNPLRGHPVARVARDGPQGIELVEVQGTVEDIAADHAQVALDIQRRLDLATQH